MPEAKEFILKDGSHISIKDESARNDIQTLSETKITKPEIDGVEGQALTINGDGDLVWGNVNGDSIGYDEENEGLYTDSSSGSGTGAAYTADKPVLGKLTFSPSQIEFNSYQDTTTVQITNTTGRKAELEPYNENDLNVNMTNDNTFTVSSVDGGISENKSGSVDFYVRSDGMHSPNLYSIPYIMKYNAPRVKFGEGTAEQILELFQANDTGKVKLDEFWNIGDERIIHLNAIPEYRNANNRLIVNAVPAVDLKFVLLHKGLYLDENEQEVHYVIGAKNMPNAYAMINYDSSKYPGWFDSDLNTYLQDYLYPALDDNDKPLFKQFICKANRNETNNRTTNTMESRVQKITIPSIVEVCTDSILSSMNSYISTVEIEQLTRFDYYTQNTNNVIKQYQYNATSAAIGSYWLRSEYASYKGYYMYNGGGPTSYSYQTQSTQSFYLAPQLCI